MSYYSRGLTPPPPLPPGVMRIIPLGGIGEIGRNMTVLETAGRLLIIDCGVLFPEDHQPGIDVILPDFSYLDGRWNEVEAVVLTHGHEDHIGAVPHLLRRRSDLPLISTRFTLALVKAKLDQEPFPDLVTIEVQEKHRLNVGPFDLEFFAVNHSIPEALALCVRTEAGTLFHTGDFKLDQTPLDGRLTDLGGLYRIGDEGLDLLLSDSTNAEIPGFVLSEREIGPVLDQLIGTAPGRVVVSCTSSHIHRVQQVLDAAHRHGRTSAFVGRSMLRNMGVARDLGFLTDQADALASVEDVIRLDQDRQMFVCTGSQGEPNSALTRIANQEHPLVKLDVDDTVILASSMIPGNESAIWRVVNQLSRLGVTVLHKGNAAIHTTGHAPAGELLYVLNALRPKNFLPIHGEPRHLRAHAKIAERAGVQADNVLLIEDGVVVDLADGRVFVQGRISAGYVFVDGEAVGDVGEVALKDRRTLRDEGVVTVMIVIEADSGRIVAGPDIGSRGLSDFGVDFAEVSVILDQAVAEVTSSGPVDEVELELMIRRTVGRWLRRNQRRTPLVLPRILLV